MYSRIDKKFKRRVDQKTNYKKRLALLKSGKNRFVLRRTNTYISLQYVVHNSKGDDSKINILSKVLNKYGWKGGFNSIPASYLAGYLFGKTAIENKLSKDMIFDIGMHNAFKKGKLFSAVKGAIDAGLNIDVPKDSFPSEDRLKGKHIKMEEMFNTVKKNIDSGLKKEPTKKPKAKKE